MAQTIGAVTQTSTGITGGAPAVVTPSSPTDIRAAYGLSYAGGRVMATKKYKPRKLSKEDIKKLMSIGFQVGKASQAAKQKAQAEALMPHINAQMRKRAA